MSGNKIILFPTVELSSEYGLRFIVNSVGDAYRGIVQTWTFHNNDVMLPQHGKFPKIVRLNRTVERELLEPWAEKFLPLMEKYISSCGSGKNQVKDEILDLMQYGLNNVNVESYKICGPLYKALYYRSSINGKKYGAYYGPPNE